MKILFGANTPAPLARFLRGHEVTLASARGWHSLKNGVLLAEAENAGFDLLLTCDQNIRYQQNLTGRNIAVVTISSNHWPTMRPLAARIASAIDFVGRGQAILVDLSLL